MSEFKGTPAPWSAVKKYANEPPNVVDGSGFEVVSVKRVAILDGWDEKGFQHWADDGGHRELSYEEYTANAYLVASAPELLEALQELVHADCHSVRNSTLHINALKKAMLAIHKALGQ